MFFFPQRQHQRSSKCKRKWILFEISNSYQRNMQTKRWLSYHGTTVRRLKFLKLVSDAGDAHLCEAPDCWPARTSVSFLLSIILWQVEAFTDQNPADFCLEGVLRPLVAKCKPLKEQHCNVSNLTGPKPLPFSPEKVWKKITRNMCWSQKQCELSILRAFFPPSWFYLLERRHKDVRFLVLMKIIWEQKRTQEFNFYLTLDMSLPLCFISHAWLLVLTQITSGLIFNFYPELVEIPKRTTNA